MRDLLFKCPRCAARLAFESKLAGRELSCPACKDRIVVPTPDTSLVCPACGTELHARSDLEGTFECPACGGQVSAKARAAASEMGSAREVKFDCPFCGQSLKAPPERAGQTCRCPNCKEASAVPREDGRTGTASAGHRRGFKTARTSPQQIEAERKAKVKFRAAVAAGSMIAVVAIVIVAFAVHNASVNAAYRDALAVAQNEATPDEGIAALQSVLARHPDARPAPYARQTVAKLIGSLYEDAFRCADKAETPDDAVKRIEAVIAKYADSDQVETAKRKIAQIKAKQKRQDDAIKAVVADATDCLKKGLPELAESRLDRALKGNPWASQTTEVTNLLQQARARLADQRKAAAVAEYRKRAKSTKPSEMIDFVRQCAEQGVPEAQRDLGWMCARGDGVSNDRQKAAEWFRKAAEQGDGEAECRLGAMYYDGTWGQRDVAEAARWWRKAADQGIVEAQVYLGQCHVRGEGVPEDYGEAAKLLARAAEQGDGQAQFSLACILTAGGHGLERDMDRGATWMRKAALQGNAKAQDNMGGMCSVGCGVPQDWTEAVKWYRRAAEQGLAGAQVRLALCYANGTGIERNYTEASKWFRKAAEQGDAEAQHNLGVHYDNGQGVPRDRAEAAKWYRLAAAQGQAAAKQRLAELAEMEQQERLAALQRDAGVVAAAYVQQLMNGGVLRKASLRGYQRGLGAELIAIFDCEYISQGGFLNVRPMSLAMSRDSKGQWGIHDFSPGGVFPGLPLESDWRRATGGGRTPLNQELRRQGYYDR